MKSQPAFIVALLGMAAAASISAGPLAKSGQATLREQPRVIQIVAHKFAFDPDQITLKKGVPVTLQLTSQDVQHGFYIRGLKVDEEIHPGKTTEVTFTPDKSGTFPTICDHFCGLGHKNMKMTVVVEE
jgi:cytochrome c oxidase subunit II